jgi:thioredoxin:protein disulfide reductase
MTPPVLVSGSPNRSGLRTTTFFRRIFLLAIALQLVLAVVSTAGISSAAASSNESAAELPSELQVPVRAQLSHATLHPGGEATLALIYEIPPNAHLQVNEFLYVQPKEGEPFTVGEPRRSATVQFEGEPVHAGRLVSWQRLRVAKDIAPGRHTLKLLAGYQGCFEKPVFACFPPVDLELDVPVEIVPADAAEQKLDDAFFASAPVDLPAAGAMAAAAPAEGATPGGPAGETGETAAGASDLTNAPPDNRPGRGGAGQPTGSAVALPEQAGLAGRLQQALAKRSFLAFLLVFLGGIATSFTPCVYPMIPITISYIGGRARHRLHGFLLSLVFVLGIAVMYSVLGVIAAVTGSLFGGLMQSMPVLIGVAVIFFAMGASMLGAFDLALPSGLQSKLQGGPRTGVVGAFFMGMVTGIVASPCVGPVLVVLLAGVAAIGSIPLGIALLFTFALGLGLLFLAIGTFAGVLSSLPQVGGWMDTVKHVFGVILIAMGIYFVRGLIGPHVTLLVSGAFLVFVGVFAGAFHALGEEPSHGRTARKALGLVIFLVGGLLLLAGAGRIMGIGLTAAPTVSGSTAAGHEAWLPDDVAGRAQAKAAGKPAVLDFWADWCGACKELDRETWSDPEIRRELERFVAVKLDLTASSDANKAKLASYGVPGLPTVIIFDASGREVTRFFGFKPPREVLDLLRKAS